MFVPSTPGARQDDVRRSEEECQLDWEEVSNQSAWAGFVQVTNLEMIALLY